MNLETRVQRSPEPLAASVDDGLVMMDLGNGKYFHLDRIGLDIWNRIEAPRRVGDLCADLQEIYSAEPETIHHDVIDLLRDLHTNGLVHEVAE